MRKYLVVFGLLISMAVFSQPDPEVLIQGVAEKMRLVDNYRADVLIKIDVDFIKIKERKAVVYFEKPDKFDIKVKGLVLMPKKGSQMEYLDLINQEHTAIYTGEDTLDIFYSGHPLNLPDRIKISFEMKGYKIPASMTGDIIETAEGIKKDEITQGIVWLEYSNYIVNYKKFELFY